MQRSRWRFLPFILYVITIFIVSSFPALTPPGPEFDYKDKVAHFFEYLILGVLLFYAIGWNVSTSKLVTFLFLFSVGFSIGALDEMFQSYVPARDASVYDLFTDAAGVATGVGLCVFSPLGRRLKPPIRGFQSNTPEKE